MQVFWKKFDETELSHSSVHHLLAINSLREQLGYARLVDVSNHLNISRASVSITIGKLKSKGFVDEDQNRFLNLSDRGLHVVNSILAKRKAVKEFFRTVLKLPENMAEINACKIEHLLDEEAGDRLARFIACYRSDSPEAHNFRREFEAYLTSGESE
jgi:DtxR family Mn-dependent transcriptional regulator